MNLSPALEKAYTKESLSARDAQRLAEFIAFGPIVFQVSRLMIKLGILDLLRDSDNGMTIDEIACKTGMSVYAVKVLVEASLTIGTVLVDKQSDKYQLSKTGWFLINDPATRVNIDFNQDVNYEGLFNLEEALKEESNFCSFKLERAKNGSSKFTTSILNCFRYKDKTSASSKSSSIIAIFIKETPYFLVFNF